MGRSSSRFVMATAGLALAAGDGAASAQAILVDTYVVETGLADGEFIMGDRTSFETGQSGLCFAGLAEGEKPTYYQGSPCKSLSILQFQEAVGPTSNVPTWETGRNPPIFLQTDGRWVSLSLKNCGSAGGVLQFSELLLNSWASAGSTDYSNCADFYYYGASSISAATKELHDRRWLIHNQYGFQPIVTSSCSNSSLIFLDESGPTLMQNGLPSLDTLLADSDGSLIGYDLRDRTLIETRIENGVDATFELGSIIQGNATIVEQDARVTSCLADLGAIVALAPVFREPEQPSQQSLRLLDVHESEIESNSVVCDESDGFCAAESSRATGANVELKRDENGGTHLCFQDTALLRESSNSTTPRYRHPGQWRHAYRAPGSEEWVFSTIFRQRSPHLNQGFFEFFEMYGFTVSAGGGYLNTVGQIRTCEGTTTVRSHEVLHMRAINFGGLDVAPSPRASIGAVLNYIEPASAAIASWDGSGDGAIDVADYVGREQ